MKKPLLILLLLAAPVHAQHWSFVPPKRPRLPRVVNRQWPSNPIDYFVLARLEREKLQPSPRASRGKLLRRLSLDLTGFPPTPAELARFLDDRDPSAYERLVDRLLASPRFGERLALHWLDAARYADTHGYHEDYHRDMWPWRSWVIRAFNQNVPFDQFTIEQLAGDLLPQPTMDQLIATGFNRNHGVTASGISEEYRVEYVLDRVRTTSTVWLGLTLQCAQCHDHKYDPITQKDFYRFFAFFNSITDKGVENRTGNVDPLIQVTTPANRMQLRRLEKTIQQLQAKRAERTVRASTMLPKWEKQLVKRGSVKQAQPAGLLLQFDLDEGRGNLVRPTNRKLEGAIVGTPRWVQGRFGKALDLQGQTYVRVGDQAAVERTQAFSYGAWIKRRGNGCVISRMNDRDSYHGWDCYFSGGKLEVHLIHRWPGNALHVKTKVTVPANKWTHVFVTYDGSSRAAGVRVYFNGQRQSVNATIDKLTGSIKTKTPLHIGRRNPSGNFDGAIDDVRVYGRALTEAEVAVVANADPITPILRVARHKRTKSQQRILREFLLTRHDPPYKMLTAQIEKLQSRLGKAKATVKNQTTMVMREMKSPRKTYLLVRGAYDKQGEPVVSGTPSFLPRAVSGKSDRLALAKWLVHPDHPLTSRVIVNRFWQVLFGAGLVKTSEDFGTQGTPPSHPKLLDWLAKEFVHSGWDVKAMLKLMVMSQTYQQTSKVSKELLARDPHNRLLARGARFRMPAEMIRDNALAIAGLVVERLGGRSVKTYQPKGLWLETSNRPYVPDRGGKLYRRSLYMYWKRSVPPPNLFAIDAPTREVCLVRRQRTNTPLMALVLLNDTTFVEAARVLAERALTQTRYDRVDYLFLRSIARKPSEDERKIVLRVRQEQDQLFRKHPQQALKLLAVGAWPRNPKLDHIEHATWTVLASLLMNLDETISRE